MLTQITQGSGVAYTRAFASEEPGMPKFLWCTGGVAFITAWERFEGILWIIGHHTDDCDAVKAMQVNAALARGGR